MKKADGKSPESEVRGPKQQGATSCPASAFSLQPSVFTRIPWWLLAGLLVLVTLALYWPATRCDFCVIDDLVLTPEVVKGLSLGNIAWAFLNPVDSLWQPLTVLSHMADCQVFGMRPWGHHLTSVLLHALNAGLVFALLQQMTGATWRSLLVAALFAFHPLRVEPVVWVDERREVLGACFGLLTLMAYVRYAQGRRQNPAAPNPQPVSRFTFHACPFYLLSLGFFACGLMSKPTIVTWPFVMLLLDYWPLGRMKNEECSPVKWRADFTGQVMKNAEASDTDHAPRNTQYAIRNTQYAIRNTFDSRQSQILWRLVREKIPFFVLAGMLIVVTIVVQQLVGSLASGRHNPIGARLGNAVVSYGWYLGKLFWPADLVMFYPHPGYWPLGKVVLAGGLILGVSVLVGAGWRRHPYLLVGWLWYCGVLVPNSQVVQTFKMARADRWTYLPLLGVLILIVWGAGELTRRWRYQALGLAVAGGVALVLCLALTRRQIGYWKDSETMARHSLEVTGDNEWALAMLGGALDRKGRTDEAIRHYQESLRLEPDDRTVRNYLGMALGRRGQLDEAITQFQEAVRLAPAYALAHYNLANTLLEKGRIDEAIRQYREVIRLLPNYVDPYNNLGLALAREGQTDEAITQYQEGLRLEPDDPDIHFNLGVALVQRGQMDEAIRHYQEALRRKPDRAEAHNNLGAAFHRQGRTGEAIREFREALRLKPDYAGARKNLNAALAAQQKAE